MKPSEAEKLLGGYATGTLTEAEQRTLFAAALGQQAIFEALMDEETLRELLADPAVKAQLLAALSAPSAEKVVPFWRRPGLIGAAASLLVAATAGLAYLRNPQAMPTVARPEVTKTPAAKTVESPAAAQVPAAPLRKVAPASPPLAADQTRREAGALAPPALAPAAAPAPQLLAASAAGTPAPVGEDSARMKEKADLRRTEVQDEVAKKAEAPRPVPVAVVEVLTTRKDAAPERRALAQSHSAGGVPGGVPGGVIGGVVGGVVNGRVAPAAAKAVDGLGTNVAAAPMTPMTPMAPTWLLETLPDGSIRVTVSAPRGRPVTLLRRGSAGVEVLHLQASDDRGKALVQWRTEVRLAAGDLLDLYLLNQPVAEPAKLPETGPLDGFRARIHPAVKD